MTALQIGATLVNFHHWCRLACNDIQKRTLSLSIKSGHGMSASSEVGSIVSGDNQLMVSKVDIS